MQEKLDILFMQSQTYFGSDSMIHSLLMRYFNRDRMEVFAACNPGTPKKPSRSLAALKKVPNLNLRLTKFGPTVNSRSKLEILGNIIVNTVPAIISLCSLILYIRKNKIVIIHGSEKPRDAFYGFLLAKLTGAKCIIHMHVKYADWISPLTRWAIKRADGIIGVSEFVANTLVENNVSPQRVFYVLNSLDATKWDPDIDGTSIRQEFGIEPETPVLAIISRLFYWKGHSELLQALAKVKQTNPKFKLLIVGEDDPRGYPKGGSYSAELKKLTRKLDLEEKVIFTGFRSDITQILAACDIFTMPSFEEPCAVAFLEAMAMRKPVIALDSGGTSQLVENGKSGLLSQPKDIDQLAENILTLQNDSFLRQKMGDYARCRVEEYFNPQRMADEVEQIYHKILAKL